MLKTNQLINDHPCHLIISYESRDSRPLTRPRHKNLTQKSVYITQQDQTTDTCIHYEWNNVKVITGMWLTWFFWTNKWIAGRPPHRGIKTPNVTSLRKYIKQCQFKTAYGTYLQHRFTMSYKTYLDRTRCWQYGLWVVTMYLLSNIS